MTNSPDSTNSDNAPKRKRRATRSQAARKAAKARWSKDRPLSQRAQKQLLSKIPTSELTIEHYADRKNPELSWAAAILKRQKSGVKQRQQAAEIMSRYGSPTSGQKLATYWQSLSVEEKRELAARGGKRRWEIWRQEQAKLHGASPSTSTN